MSAIKVRSGSLGRDGRLTAPASWREDLGLKEGDPIDFLRDEQDRLIVVPAEKKTTGGER